MAENGGDGVGSRPSTLREALTSREWEAAYRLIGMVRDEVAAELVEASLFGSKARGEARPDSDIDLLLVFRQLPWDREPQASHAEALAEDVAAASGIPVTVWSVSLVDLERGQRTPMLVDALQDSIPLWWSERPLPAVPFTPPDAVRCAGALLDRVAEGSEEFAELSSHRALEPAARRVRDDVVRLCIGLHLLRGRTRPRRGEAAAEVLELDRGLPAWARPVLEWASRSYGPDGRDEEAPVTPPPGGLARGARVIDLLRQRVAAERRRLAAGSGRAEPRPAGRI